MNKLGQGFSKVYNQSQYDHSYYAGGRGSNTAADDMHGSISHKNLNDPMLIGQQKPGGKRARPMTAKINNKRGQF